MNKVRSKRLGDLITFKRGYDLPEHNRTPGPYPVISSAGVSGYHNEYKVEGEGVVTGRYGTLGEMYFVNGKYWPHNTALYIQNFKGNDPKYIYYLLSCLGRIRTSDKSAVPGVNRNELHEMFVPAIEDKTMQIAIRKVLEALDVKIELNNRINAELEAMAKTFYDYWFVQFDFPFDFTHGKPDANGKPYKSSGGKMIYNSILKREIPEGWKVRKLEQIATVVRGASPRPIDDYLSESGLPWIKISDATASENRFILETKQFIKEEGKAATRVLSPNKLILSNSATPAIPRITKIESGIHDGWLYIDNFKYGFSKEILYQFFLNERSRILNLGNGSIFKNLKTDYIKSISLISPPETILENASALLMKISDLLYTNSCETKELEELRDWLLPMLMNGQVTVK